jgi:DNA-binding FadR family transcriptional regulator
MRLYFSPGKASDAKRLLTSCITGADDPTGNLAHEAVSAVEMQLLQRHWPVGEALGALPDVQKDLGIGRPACREALIILEARGLLEIRRGPGGGLFVAAPTAEDVVGAMLMYLTLSGTTGHCIQEFRLLVWRMVVEAAIDRRVDASSSGTGESGTGESGTGEWGFAVELAQRLGNPPMALAAQIAEMLVRTCDGRAAPGHDVVLARAVSARNKTQAFARLDELTSSTDLATPILALEAMERSFAWAGRKSAMALAARMSREMINQPERLEAEWETADRLGYSDAAVRQARRILQDFGVVRCQRGRKGAFWGPPTSPAGVIRLLAPCLIASGMTARDNAEAANSLACYGPRLAAARVAEHGESQTRVLASYANSLELIDLIRTENLILDLACNPLLSIMTRSLGLANLLSPEAKISLQRRAEIVAINHRILRAIEAGDVEAAGRLARAKGEIHQSEASYRKLA